MKLADNLAVVCLIRQDDSMTSEDDTNDGKRSLDLLIERMKKKAEDVGCDFSVQDEFFVLGRTSKALVLSVSNLSSVTRCIRSLAETGSDARKDTNPKLGIFDINAFPCIRPETDLPKTKGIVPCLLFARSEKPIRDLEGILKNHQSLDCLCEASIGFGSFNLIFTLKGNTISNLSKTIFNIRKLQFVETRTIFGVPAESLRDEEKKLAASEPLHGFSIMAKYAGRTDSDFEGDVQEIAQSDFSTVFDPLRAGEQRITLRQGYMDVEIPCKSRTTGEIFDATCSLRRKVNGIFDTATEIRIPCPTGARLNLGGTNRNE